MSLLTGGAYGVSALLIVYAIGAEIAPEELRFPLLIAWAVAGLLLAALGLVRSKA